MAPERYILEMASPRRRTRPARGRRETIILTTIVGRIRETLQQQTLTQTFRSLAAIASAAALLLTAAAAHAQNGKLAPKVAADYENKYEVYGGASFMDFQAGQNLPKRMNLGGAEAMGTWWVLDRLGVAADYRFEGGTTPVFPVHGFNRVPVFQNIGMAGVQYRGPRSSFAAIDYHALAGVSHGDFDQAIRDYPGGTSFTTQDLGVYSNRTKPFYALGGSIDFNRSRNLAIRIQPDLILEHFGTELREFVGVSGGVVYRIGHK